MKPQFKVLGVRVDAVQMGQVVVQMERWIDTHGKGHFIAATGLHGVSEAHRDNTIRKVLNSADLVVPDGMPLVWLARWHGFPIRRRVYGPELMETFCRETGSRYRHFFYGGASGVAEELAFRLQHRHGITVAGTYTPPFHQLSDHEEKSMSALVGDCVPDVLWVGLSTPKQECWMYEHRNKLNVPVMVGVGAAFDLNSGRLRQAPVWMRESGLEWFFRLIIEPRRLWKRYLVKIPRSIWSVTLEMLRITKCE